MQESEKVEPLSNAQRHCRELQPCRVHYTRASLDTSFHFTLVYDIRHLRRHSSVLERTLERQTPLPSAQARCAALEAVVPRSRLPMFDDTSLVAVRTRLGAQRVSAGSRLDSNSAGSRVSPPPLCDCLGGNPPGIPGTEKLLGSEKVACPRSRSDPSALMSVTGFRRKLMPSRNHARLEVELDTSHKKSKKKLPPKSAEKVRRASPPSSFPELLARLRPHNASGKFHIGDAERAATKDNTACAVSNLEMSRWSSESACVGQESRQRAL